MEWDLLSWTALPLRYWWCLVWLWDRGKVFGWGVGWSSSQRRESGLCVGDKEGWLNVSLSLKLVAD